MNDYNIHITGQCYPNHNSCNFCKYGSEYSIYFLKKGYQKPRFELNFISENGLWSPNENENFLGYHAMTIVGYNDYIFGGAFRIVTYELIISFM